MTYELGTTYRVGQTVRLTRDVLRLTSKYAMTYHKGQQGKVIQVPDEESGLGQYAIELGADLAPNFRRVYWEGDAPEQHRFEDDVELVTPTAPPMPFGKVLGYEGLPETMEAHLRAIEDARDKLSRARGANAVDRYLDELQETRKAFTRFILDDDRAVALGDERPSEKRVVGGGPAATEGYEALPERVVDLLVNVEHALAFYFDETTSQNQQALVDARATFTSYVIDALREWDPREQDDEPRCEGCGRQSPSECGECVPCYVTFTPESAAQTGGCASGEFMYCEECIEKGQGDIRVGEPDGKESIVRLDWRFFEAGALSRFYRVVPTINGDRFALQACDVKKVHVGSYANEDSIVDVRRWPFGLGGLNQLNRLTGASFVMGDFDNAC